MSCIKFDFGCGSAPDPAGELTTLPQTHYLDFRELLLREGGEEKGNEKGKRGEVKGLRGREG